MDGMKMFVGMLVTALALCFAGTASAQDEDTSQQVDWEEAATYAELTDTWVNDSDVEMATYYDEAQNVLWSQPASMSVEEGAAVLTKGPEYAETLLVSTWVLPTVLWLCGKDEADDSGCDDGDVTNYKWGSDDIELEGTYGNLAIYHAACLDPEDGLYQLIQRVYAKGTSYTTDYCEAGYEGAYHDGSTWVAAEENWCTQLTIYNYYLDESTDVDDYEYDVTESTPPVAAFKYPVTGSSYRYSQIFLARCL
jgi:hypothetical protein